MCKKLLVCIAVLLLAGTASFADLVWSEIPFVPTDTQIGFRPPLNSGGSTTGADGTFTITGGGADVWDNWDQFQYAYITVTGNVRIETNADWIVAPDWWSKMGVMLRVPALNYLSLDSFDARDSVHYSSIIPRGSTNPTDWWPSSTFGFREADGGGSGDQARWEQGVQAIGVAIERIIETDGTSTINAYALYDPEFGWESLGSKTGLDLPDTLMVGLMVTSHMSRWGEMATAEFTNAKVLVPEPATIALLGLGGLSLLGRRRRR